MHIYLVGGAVRDELLGLPVTERDWLVVGATPDDLLALGFKCVGREFPVFLHPKTQEEYALARTERKTGKGYRGFAVNASEHVTLADDLIRRDLTINAIAKDEHNAFIDPFHGIDDLQQRILRHVSPAFSEDPVRLLRVARFMARFHPHGFHIHPDTLHLMQNMVKAGEIDALVPERVFREWSRALKEPAPEQFFITLHDTCALSRLFPEVDVNGAGMQALTHFGTERVRDSLFAFALLLHDLPESDIATLCQRYRAPNNYRFLAMSLSRHHDFLLSPALLEWDRTRDPLHAEIILDFFLRMDAFRRHAFFAQLIQAAEHLALSKNIDFSREKWMSAHRLVSHIDIAPLIKKGLKGKGLVRAIHQARLEKLLGTPSPSGEGVLSRYKNLVLPKMNFAMIFRLN